MLASKVEKEEEEAEEGVKEWGRYFLGQSATEPIWIFFRPKQKFRRLATIAEVRWKSR